MHVFRWWTKSVWAKRVSSNAPDKITSDQNWICLHGIMNQGKSTLWHIWCTIPQYIPTGYIILLTKSVILIEPLWHHMEILISVFIFQTPTVPSHRDLYNVTRKCKLPNSCSAAFLLKITILTKRSVSGVQLSIMEFGVTDLTHA